MNKRLMVILGSLFILFGTANPFAAVDTVVDLNLHHLVNVVDDGSEVSTGYLMGSQASVSFKSSDTGNVRGDLALSLREIDFSGTLTTMVTMDRAYLRVRFPQFRLTGGKTRVGWGDGMLFNAADLLFGSSDTDVILTDAELRTSTKWLTSVTIPLGAFSFIEAVVIPPASTPYDWKDTELGARYYTTMGSMKMETGGAYRDDDTGKVVSPYVALQGNFGPDWYLASHVNIAYPTTEIEDELKDSWIFSGGLFHMVTVGWQGMLSLRLEALVRPFGDWQAVTNPSYGLLLYPEVTYAPDDTWNFSFRSIISPIDTSVMIMLGTTWNVMQGFTLNGYVTAQAGESNDTFSWTSPTSSLAVMMGASWVY